MKVEIFDPNHFATTGKIFADAFEDPRRFAYHGTSTLHASSIEQQGFRPYFKLFDPLDLIELAQSIPDQTNSCVEWLQREATGAKRLSFAQYAVRAAAYAMAGQSVRVIQNAMAAGGVLPPAIASFMQQAQQSQPCIYVIDFEDLTDLDITLEYGVIHCKTSLPASRVAAKMILPIHPAVQAAAQGLPPAYQDLRTALGAKISNRR
ncbi:hypothetical protein R69608_03389 [Paraburkholderia nemoris]|uniref:hypothetical protein n=1 Tax=Paraburkholderia nemoris TaxID=2793076 RepID=UPI001912B6CB|nr:hypothetical protein [Paraburkholderia nemoris]MBK5148717.1 hypothetical protein [Burkholderia sp. R-69608]CAE6908658.1 hypothetical protein R69608_03389 [Paraburkholderia nemoris]